MTGRWLVPAGLVLLLAVPTSLAQPPEQAEPAIEVEIAPIQALVIPLGEPAETTIQVRVGCAPGEAAMTTTQARLSAPNASAFENPVISPASLSWTTQPGDCPSLGMPFVANATLSLALAQTAPGFEEQRLPVEVVVEKRLAGDPGPNQTYGPTKGEVRYTPGFFNLWNLRLDQKIAKADAGETAVYQPTIDNFSNHETRFNVSLASAPDGVAVGIEPEQLVLSPNQTGGFEVRVSLDGPVSRFVNEVAAVEIQVDAATTHRLGGEEATSRLSMLTQFRRIPGDDIPATGSMLTAGLAALVAVGLAVWRRRGEP